MEIKIKDYVIYFDCNEELTLETKTNEENGVLILSFKISNISKKYLPRLDILWYYKIIGIHSCWHPNAQRNKRLMPDWNEGFISNATYSAPIVCFYGLNGNNRMTCAYSDALNTVNMKMGVHEENGTLACSISLFSEPTINKGTYKAEIRIDNRNIKYYEAIADVSKWWADMGKYTPAIVPKCATNPMYSTWYSYHQDIESQHIEKQCAISKSLGCETVIVDDGWQTSDSNRGYAYCGDWKISKQRIPDMKKHVEKIHDLGMKYILWYSVPFVGIKSMAYKRFEDKLLNYKEDIQAGVLDPRYLSVREYLINTYVEALKNWDLDGFKLDFVDEFKYSSIDSKVLDEKPDFSSVQEAVNCLLVEIKQRLRAIKPDIMIEFRQRYIGPCMRKYGNMFRVGDCPADFISNRVGSIDLRLLAGNTSVHSDMVMWNQEDSVESAALQIINAIFSVIQISVRLDTLPEEHYKMVEFWLKFCRENKDVLLEGEIKPVAPELMYPMVIAEISEKKLIALYYYNIIDIDDRTPKIVIVNGTDRTDLVIRCNSEHISGKKIVRDCCGNITSEGEISFTKGLHQIDVCVSGIIILEIIDRMTSS